jgi:hypothetical protein
MVATLESLPPRLAHSALARGGGALVARLLTAESLAALQAEATACRAHAEAYRVDQDDGEEHRGGNPDRWLDSALGGPRLRAIYGSPVIADLLARVTALSWAPSGGDGTYSYYCREGHHLGIHRDVAECDLALILCVSDRYSDDPGLAGMLCLYPGRTAEPLSAIRAHPGHGARHLRVRPGEATILLGGIVPHRVVPIGPGHARVVAPLCFRATG